MKDRIKQAREAAGLSQGQLARLLGCSRSLVTQWENGETWPGPWVESIADYLEVSKFWLLTGEPEEVVDVGTLRGAERLRAEDRRKVQKLLDLLVRVPREKA